MRVVAKGFTQVHGVNYNDTFSPVARLESFRMALDITVAEDWEIDQLDVKMAFLHRDLEEEVYMEQLEGMEEHGKESWVAKLDKGLYELK
jgi:hypothetical protein